MISRPDSAALSVSALTQLIAEPLESMGSLLVQGEIAQARQVSSGHYYATLKDETALIQIVCWRSRAERLGRRLPKDGDAVLVSGTLSVYGPRGQYQLVAHTFRPLGQGSLAQRFEELKARLQEEGLFDPARKQSLPFLPRGVGIATGAGSAAEADILEGISRRFPNMILTLAPCLVQGATAAASICAALQELDQDPDVDVIILGRGGGSLEDLWAFNEESVVRAIVACRTPVIAAVGHETDYSLADFAADLRAKTPSAAGELVVPCADDLYEELAQAEQNLRRSMQRLLSQAEAELQALTHHRALRTPRYQWEVRSQRLDELALRLDHLLPRKVADTQHRLHDLSKSLQHHSPQQRLSALRLQLQNQQQRLATSHRNRLHSYQQRFQQLSATLEALSPLAIIARGYALISDQQGQALSSCKQIQPGMPLDIQFKDGHIRATADGKKS